MGYSADSVGIAQRLEHLVATEKKVSIFSSRPAPRAWFRSVGNWLVEERYLLALLRNRLRGPADPVPPRLGDADIFRILRALVMPPRLEARSHAQALFMKTHLRAFYLEPRAMSLKIVSSEDGNLLRQDFDTRAKAVELGAPRIIDHCLEGPSPYLCEEWISGCHPDPIRDADEIVRFVAGELWNGYGQSGFEWRSLADSHDLGALIANFDAMTDEMPWPSHLQERKSARDALLNLESESAKLVPWCFGHGDLSVGNMLLTDGRVRLIDWERARRMPLLLELSKILAIVPASWDPITARMRDAFTGAPDPGMLQPDLQAALASLERLVQIRDRFSAATPAAAISRREASRFERRLGAELNHLAARLR